MEEWGELRNWVTDSSNFMKEFEQVYLYKKKKDTDRWKKVDNIHAFV
jgi:hypothetical protein